jgi:hypothetical protein
MVNVRKRHTRDSLNRLAMCRWWPSFGPAHVVMLSMRELPLGVTSFM